MHHVCFTQNKLVGSIQREIAVYTSPCLAPEAEADTSTLTAFIVDP